RGGAFSDDVERGSMGRRGEDRVEACGDRDAAVEATQLGRDLPLVVVHGNDAVIFAGEGLDVDRGGGKWSLAVYARACRRANRGADQIDLLAPEEPILSRMWIESGNRDARLLDACPLHGPVDEFDGFNDAAVSDLIQRGAQRDMRRDARHPLAI